MSCKDVKRDERTVGSSTKPKGSRDGMRGSGRPAGKEYEESKKTVR